MKNSDKPISPLLNSDGFPKDENDIYFKDLIGLTKREYFAVMAMQGLLSNPAQSDLTEFKWVAQVSISYADDLLDELDKSKN